MSERDEMARVSTGFTGKGPAPGGDPVADLGERITRSLVEAGFSLHNCDQLDPVYRLGGVCLRRVQAGPGENPAGVSVSWTTHDLLLFDESRWATYSVIIQVMNSALGTALRALGYEAEPFGTGGAWIVPRPGVQRTEGVAP